MTEFLRNPETWVGAGFLIVVIGFIWLRVPVMVTKALDARAAAIAAELDEARRLREEAEAVLAQYKRKASEAETEAQAIITQAQQDAERFALEANAQLKLQIERRTQQAKDKIAQAEAAAAAEIRTLAADAAAAAAEKLIAARLDEQRAAKLIAESIREIPGKLN